MGSLHELSASGPSTFLNFCRTKVTPLTQPFRNNLCVYGQSCFVIHFLFTLLLSWILSHFPVVFSCAALDSEYSRGCKTGANRNTNATMFTYRIRRLNSVFGCQQTCKSVNQAKKFCFILICPQNVLPVAFCFV